MTDKDLNALIFTPPSSMEKAGHGPNQILPEMVSDALAVAKSKQVETKNSIDADRQQNIPSSVAPDDTPRFEIVKLLRRMEPRKPLIHKLGEYQLCDPDFQQIHSWAKSLRMAPNVLLQTLAKTIYRSQYEDTIGSGTTFFVEHGRIKNVVWDFDALPIEEFRWQEGLRIETLFFMGTPTAGIVLDIPSLLCLNVSYLDLTELNLTGVPGLLVLFCRRNRLSKLDVSNHDYLEVLCCDYNQIKELKFGTHMTIGILSCAENKLESLNVSRLSSIESLWCGGNQISKLDLSNARSLKTLSCTNNPIESLDIRQCSALKNFFKNSGVRVRRKALSL